MADHEEDVTPGVDGLALEETIHRFSSELGLLRARQVDGRIEKLLGAGVPMNRLHLLDRKDCGLCHGAGASVRLEGTRLIGDLCPDCLGVAMIIDRRTCS